MRNAHQIVLIPCCQQHCGSLRPFSRSCRGSHSRMKSDCNVSCGSPIISAPRPRIPISRRCKMSKAPAFKMTALSKPGRWTMTEQLFKAPVLFPFMMIGVSACVVTSGRIYLAAPMMSLKRVWRSSLQAASHHILPYSLPPRNSAAPRIPRRPRMKATHSGRK